MFIAVWAGSANQRAQKQKAGYQAAKLAGPDISLDVTFPKPEINFQDYVTQSLETGMQGKIRINKLRNHWFKL